MPAELPFRAKAEEPENHGCPPPYHVQTALPPLVRHSESLCKECVKMRRSLGVHGELLSTHRHLVPQPLGVHMLPADVTQTWGSWVGYAVATPSGFPDQGKPAPTAELTAAEEHPAPWCANLYHILIKYPLNICVYKLTLLFRLKHSHWHSHCF